MSNLIDELMEATHEWPDPELVALLEAAMTELTKPNAALKMHRKQALEIEDEILKLQAFKDKFPKTEDGVTITPGMKVYHIVQLEVPDKEGTHVELGIRQQEAWYFGDETGVDCYSTHKLAEVEITKREAVYATNKEGKKGEQDE